MKDILIIISGLIFCIVGFYFLAKTEKECFEKKLKNDIEIVKMIIEESKK